VGYFQEMDPDESFQPFSIFREYFGFVPRLFRAQALPGTDTLAAADYGRGGTGQSDFV
jgi:hypothetical protein